MLQVAEPAPRKLRLLPCVECGRTVPKFPSQIRGLVFCSKGCRASHGLTEVKCFWPSCSTVLKARQIRMKNRYGTLNTVYKTDLRRRGEYTKFPFCAAHSAKITQYLGNGKTRPGSRSIVLSDPEFAFDSRAMSVRFVRMLLFDRADGKCQGCGAGLDWLAPPKTWEVDHVVPVFRGGLTKLNNLQVLCADCHRAKTAPEKSEVAKARWAGRHDRATRWMTHYEKDRLIESLRAEIAALRGQS